MPEQSKTFPIIRYKKGTIFYRIHKEVYDPEEFRRGKSRFDDPDEGDSTYLTSYFSTEALGSYAEVFGRFRKLTDDHFDIYVITEYTLAQDLDVVHLDLPSNLGRHSIDSSYYSSSDYSKSRALAKRIYNDKYKGIKYPLRYSLGRNSPGIGLFSSTPKPKGLFSKVIPLGISESLKNLARRHFHIRVHKSFKSPKSPRSLKRMT